MRLLHLADIHLDRSFGWLGPERGRRRRQELRDTLQRGVALARDLQVDALCIAGDLYDRENAGLMFDDDDDWGLGQGPMANPE